MTTLLDDDNVIPEEESGTQTWYISWADMTTLLMTYFIVIFSFSTVSKDKFAEATNSIQRAFRVPITTGVPVRPDLEGDRSAQEIQEMIAKQSLAGILVQDFGDRVVLSMNTDVAFESGKADLTPEGLAILEKLGPALKQAPGEIRVEGHTCDLPLAPGGVYADNWGLATARAVKVLEVVVAQGISPKRIGAAGYADQRPVVPNDGEEGRRKNRRVEFVIEKKMIRADE